VPLRFTADQTNTSRHPRHQPTFSAAPDPLSQQMRGGAPDRIENFRRFSAPSMGKPRWKERGRAQRRVNPKHHRIPSIKKQNT
jgi:hypothetical protein